MCIDVKTKNGWGKWSATLGHMFVSDNHCDGWSGCGVMNMYVRVVQK